MIIQYYCYLLPNGYPCSGIEHGTLLNIGYGLTECEWIVPGTMKD